MSPALSVVVVMLMPFSVRVTDVPSYVHVVVAPVGVTMLAALPYLPAGIALGWTYEKSNTIWAPIALHMLINAIAFGVLSISI